MEVFGASMVSWRLLGGLLIDFWRLSDGFWAPWVPFWEAFSIKNRSKFDVNVDDMFDMIFYRFSIAFWRLFGSKIDHF